jgi:hypothetical protein
MMPDPSPDHASIECATTREAKRAIRGFFRACIAEIRANPDERFDRSCEVFCTNSVEDGAAMRVRYWPLGYIGPLPEP